MKIEATAYATDELVAALQRLLPQLSSRRRGPDLDELQRIVAQPGTALFVARDDGEEIVGTLTLLVFRVPSGTRARIEEVVVDEAARGQGVGEALTRAALAYAQERGAQQVELSSRPQREAANRLYQRLGFRRRETNVYVWRPTP